MYNPDDKINFSAYSSLFNAVDKSMFIHELSNQVKFINTDQNNLNLKIRNEFRLKKILFEEIRNKFNNRINSYGLNLDRLSNSDIGNLEIVKFYLTSDKYSETSGYYNIFPRTFECEDCGDFRVFSNNEEWENFDPKHCRVPGCKGKYSQVPFVVFCEDCGKIESIYINCPKHGHDYLKLTKKDPEAPSSWKIVCTQCDDKRDLLPMCYHNKRTLLDQEPTKFKPINVNNGGIFRSCVRTIVDVPERKDSEYIDEILIGSYLGIWESFIEGADLTQNEIVEDLVYYLNKLHEYPTEKDRKTALRRGVKPEVFKKAAKIKEEIESIKKNYVDIAVAEINDYLILKDIFSENDGDSKNLHYDEIVEDEGIYNQFKEEMGLEDITYIPDMQLISSSIGVIMGVNKFYEKDFTPHFEPHWRNKEHDKFKIYAYPFETEGILFDLDKNKLVDWIRINSKHPDALPKNCSSKDFLFNLDKKSKDYENLITLIHTFSHVLIKRSSLYTGLNSDSCSELLFPKNGAFLIYSTSNVNIGGFSFVFENSLFEWFNNVKLDIEDCVFDPTCIDEKGACFSCTYLPEYVCSHFNNFLDRDVFIGEKRFKSYW